MTSSLNSDRIRFVVSDMHHMLYYTALAFIWHGAISRDHSPGLPVYAADRSPGL